MKFSILLLIYNSDLNSILLTLKSILLQEFKDYEVIIADDGSKQKWKNEIETFFSKYGFRNYVFAPDNENVGTVKNILRGLNYATGRFVKLIGAGDLLYNNKVLNEVYEVMMEGECSFLFGNMRSYQICDGMIINNNFNPPWCKSPYSYNKRNRILENVIIEQDYISGASMFFETAYLRGKLKEIENIVKYVEDIIQVLILLQEEKIKYLSQCVVLYEVGSGISTSGKSNIRISEDSKNFWQYIYTNYKNDILIKKKRYSQASALKKKLRRWSKHPIMNFKNTKWRNFDSKFQWLLINKNLGFLEDKKFTDEFGLRR